MQKLWKFKKFLSQPFNITFFWQEMMQKKFNLHEWGSKGIQIIYSKCYKIIGNWKFLLELPPFKKYKIRNFIKYRNINSSSDTQLSLGEGKMNFFRGHFQ